MTQSINQEHPRIKNRSFKEQGNRDELAKILKEKRNVGEFVVHTKRFGDVQFEPDFLYDGYRMYGDVKKASKDFEMQEINTQTYLKKNREFFQKMDEFKINEKIPVTFVTDDSGMGFFSLIQFIDKSGKKHVIPTQVFLNAIVKRNNFKMEESEDYDKNIKRFENYLKDNYNIVATQNIDRYQYEQDIEQQEYENQIKELKDKLSRGQTLSKEDINSLIYYILHSDDKENIFNYGIPAKDMIEYVFDDTYHHSHLLYLERSEEVLGKELKEFYKKAKIQKLQNYAYYGNLGTWAKKYASDELENRFEKIELFDLIKKGNVINDFPLKGNGTPDAVLLGEEGKKEYKDYIIEGHGGNTGESDSNIITKYVGDSGHEKKVLIYYKETPENVAKIVQEKKEFQETLSAFRKKFGDDMVVVEYNTAAGYITYNHRGHSVYDDKFAMNSMLKGKQPYDTCYVVPGGRGFRTGWSESEFEDINKRMGVKSYES